MFTYLNKNSISITKELEHYAGGKYRQNISGVLMSTERQIFSIFILRAILLMIFLPGIMIAFHFQFDLSKIM